MKGGYRSPVVIVAPCDHGTRSPGIIALPLHTLRTRSRSNRASCLVLSRPRLGARTGPPVRVLIVSGIFPPDIGGPATHSSDLAAELRKRGHDARVLTLTDEPESSSTPSVVRFPRRWPWPVRSARVFAWLVTHGRKSDVVYATGLTALAVTAARLIGRPVVVKVAGDPAWERGSRRGLTSLSFDEFQEQPATGARIRAMQQVRNRSIGAATAVVTPSGHLAETVSRWTGRDDVTVVPNGATTPPEAATADPIDSSGTRSRVRRPARSGQASRSLDRSGCRCACRPSHDRRRRSRARTSPGARRRALRRGARDVHGSPGSRRGHAPARASGRAGARQQPRRPSSRADRSPGVGHARGREPGRRHRGRVDGWCRRPARRRRDRRWVRTGVPAPRRRSGVARAPGRRSRRRPARTGDSSGAPIDCWRSCRG